MSETNRDFLGRFVRKDGTNAPPRIRNRQPRPPALKHFRVDAILTDGAERDEYERLLAHPNTTVRQLHQWFSDRGHEVSLQAITRHRQAFYMDIKQVREVSKMASTYCELTRKYGPAAVAEASHGRFEMMLMQNLFNHPDAKQMPPADWQTMCKTVQGVVATRRNVEQMRSEQEAKAKQAAAEAAAAAKKPVTSAEVADHVAEMLGVWWPRSKESESEDESPGTDPRGEGKQEG
jgi:hypothetical protein